MSYTKILRLLNKFAKLSDEQYKEMIYMNISHFLNNIIIEMIDILESDKEIEIEQLFKYNIIENT